MPPNAKPAAKDGMEPVIIQLLVRLILWALSWLDL